MKITLLHYSSWPVVGGVETVIARHAQLMAQAGHQVTVIAGQGEAFDSAVQVEIVPLCSSRHADILNIKAHLDKGIMPPQFETICHALKAELQNLLAAQDVVILHNVASLHKNLPLTVALYQLHLQSAFPRLVLWHHDLAWTTPRYAGEVHAGFPWDLLRRAWPKATQVTISLQRQLEVAELMQIPPATIYTIPNGVDVDRFLSLSAQTRSLVNELSLLQADPLFLLPARLTPRKNIELALQILTAIVRTHPQAKLIITGPAGPHNPANAGYKEKLLRLRDQLNLKDKAIFLAETTTEFLPDSVIADLYRVADALLFPSFEEGFGIPIIEAGFSRLPVFCSDLPVLRSLGGADLNYFSVEADPHHIAQQITTHLDLDTTLRWRRRVRQSFSWDSIYKNHIAPLLEELKK